MQNSGRNQSDFKIFFSNRKSIERIILLSAFGVAMAFLETAVVVYLREILYPKGFTFPLVPIGEKLAVTEFLREAATLIMLIAVGWMSGRTKLEKFVLFLYAFAIWDLFYYIFLKLLICWPESILSWDILFLIPITWTAPVLFPVLSSLSMIIFAFAVIYFTNKYKSVHMQRMEWVLIIAGACCQFISYIWDYSRFILHHYSFFQLWSIQGKKALYSLSMQYIPESFPWGLFLAGELMILASVFLFWRRLRD
jgi:hypothetical protein